MVAAAWGVSAASLVVLYVLQRRGIGFGIRVLIGMALGLAVGTFFKEQANDIGIFGRIYVNLIRMVVMPLVGAAIVTSVTTLSNPGQLKKIGLKTVGLFLGTTAVAAAIGLAVGSLFNLGAGVALTVPKDFKAREIPSFTQVIMDQVPSNPFTNASNNQVIPVVIFSLFVAVAIIQLGAKKPELVKPVKDVIKSFTEVMFQVTKLVIRLTPYGVFGLLTTMGAKYGLSSLLPMGKVIAATYTASAIHMIVVFGGLLLFVAKVSPIRFFRKAIPAASVAFTTRSSYAAMPVNLEVVTKRMRVSDRIASFVVPLGSSINFNGCGGLWPAIVAVFVARAYNLPLDFSGYLLVVAAATIGSIGVAGVSGPASIATTVVLTAVGLPVEGMAILLGIDAIVDMARTAVNVIGDTVSSVVVANWEGEFDREAFDSEPDGEIESAAA